MLNAYNELEPIIYGESGIKVDPYSFQTREMCFPAHWHNRIELLQITSGSMEVYLDNECFIASSGQIVLIMPSMIHCCFSNEEGVTYNMIAFEIDYLSNSTIASAKYLMPIAKQKIKFMPLLEHTSIKKAIQELVNLMTIEKKSNSLLAIGKTYELLNLLYKHCTIINRQTNKATEHFELVLNYINEHYTEPITVKSISQQFGYNEAYFCRRFKKATGITIMNYIRVLRLEYAQKLLKDTSESIRSIAWRCGFTDTPYFSNCFKQHFGITPTEFRTTSR